MIDVVETIRDWLLSGGYNSPYKLQGDEWRDTNIDSDQFIVIYANSGTIEGSLQENPGIRLMIVGEVEAASRGVGSVVETSLSIIDYCRDVPEFDCLAMIQPISMPSGTGKTEGKRPFIEINLTSIIR